MSTLPEPVCSITMEKVPGIYWISCSKDPRIYLGDSSDVWRRLGNHRAFLRQGSSNPTLQAAWDKYGEEAFTFHLWLEAPVEDHPWLVNTFIKTFQPKLFSEVQPRLDLVSSLTEKSEAQTRILKLREAFVQHLIFKPVESSLTVEWFESFCKAQKRSRNFVFYILQNLADEDPGGPLFNYTDGNWSLRATKAVDTVSTALNIHGWKEVLENLAHVRQFWEAQENKLPLRVFARRLDIDPFGLSQVLQFRLPNDPGGPLWKARRGR